MQWWCQHLDGSLGAGQAQEVAGSSCLSPIRLLLLGIGAALGLSLWPLLLPLLVLVLLTVAFGRQRHERFDATAARPGIPQAPVLDPLIKARSLAQVRRINAATADPPLRLSREAPVTGPPDSTSPT